MLHVDKRWGWQNHWMQHMPKELVDNNVNGDLAWCNYELDHMNDEFKEAWERKFWYDLARRQEWLKHDMQ